MPSRIASPEQMRQAVADYIAAGVALATGEARP